MKEKRDPAYDVSARNWARKWRRFVNGKWTKIRVQDFIPIEEKRNKAGF